MPVTEPNLVTDVFRVSDGRLSAEALASCVAVLKKSGVIAVPTDTVYGLVCNAFDPVAIQKIYDLKGRDYKKPLPVFLHSSEQLPLVAKDISKEVFPLVNAYWPGPLTLVLKTASVALAATHGKETIAVRVPDHGAVTQLLDAMHFPLAATSANQSGQPALNDGASVIKMFGNQVDIIVDGGRCRLENASSVVDVTHYPFTVLRQGALDKADLYKRLHQAP